MLCSRSTIYSIIVLHWNTLHGYTRSVLDYFMISGASCQKGQQTRAQIAWSITSHGGIYCLLGAPGSSSRASSISFLDLLSFSLSTCIILFRSRQSLQYTRYVTSLIL